MNTIINVTTAPWVLGALGLSILVALLTSLKSWRQTKRSPYFFMRQQAERRLRANLLITLILIGVTAGTVAFAWQPPVDTTPRMALIANAKPVEAAEAETASSETEAEEIAVIAFDEGPDAVDISSLSPVADGPTEAVIESGSSSATTPPEGLRAAPELPDEYDQYEPRAELRENSQFSSLVFSSEITDEYEPVSPRRTFGQGFYTIYATFYYEGMADGVEWAWVWRRNGEVVNGGNELWSYGDDGPGWIFYNPPEGFQPGEYTLEVWVNGELFQQGTITVETGVANQ